MSEAPVSAARKDGKTLITLGSAVDIRCATELKKKLSAVLKRKPPMHIDASRVDRIDTAGLQILLGFVLEARNLGIEIAWQGVSDGMRSAAALIGLQDQLGIAN